MRSRLFRFGYRKSQKSKTRSVASAQPQLELLEDRVVPALVNHGGPILASVQAQALYLGSGWSTASIRTSRFDSFLSTTVSGTTTNPAPYLALLNKAGFTGVNGSGSASTGAVDKISVPS